MKRVTIFVGSARKKHTYQAAQLFAENLRAAGGIESEVVFLHKYSLKPCLGCLQCFERGEEFCPLDDDRDLLLEKIRLSDGFVLASPNYSFQVSGLLKVFLDRFGFVFHRPLYFDKTYTNIVTQGIFGGGSIVKYLDFIGNGLRCRSVPGVCVSTMEPMSDLVHERNHRRIKQLASRFQRELLSTKKPKTSLFSVVLFRISRTSMQVMLGESSRDFRYFQENNWFASDYYYPVKLGLFAKAIGKMADLWARRKYSRTLPKISA